MHPFDFIARFRPTPSAYLTGVILMLRQAIGP